MESVVLSAWVLAYRIVIGFMWGASDRESGTLALPTHEVCEAVRDELEHLPPLAHGALVVEPCRERPVASEAGLFEPRHWPYPPCAPE